MRRPGAPSRSVALLVAVSCAPTVANSSSNTAITQIRSQATKAPPPRLAASAPDFSSAQKATAASSPSNSSGSWHSLGQQKDTFGNLLHAKKKKNKNKNKFFRKFEDPQVDIDEETPATRGPEDDVEMAGYSKEVVVVEQQWASSSFQPNRPILQSLQLTLEQFRRVFSRESTSVEAVPFKRPYVIGTCVWNFSPVVDIVFESKTSMIQGSHQHKISDFGNDTSAPRTIFPSDEKFLPTLDSNNLAVKRAMSDALRMLCSGGQVSPSNSLQIFKTRVNASRAYRSAMTLLETLDLSIRFSFHISKKKEQDSTISVGIDLHDPFASSGPIKKGKPGYAVPILTLPYLVRSESHGFFTILENSITEVLIPYLLKRTAKQKDLAIREAQLMLHLHETDPLPIEEGQNDDFGGIPLQNIVNFRSVARTKFVRTVGGTQNGTCQLRCKIQDDVGNIATFNFQPAAESLLETVKRSKTALDFNDDSTDHEFLVPPLGPGEADVAISDVRLEALQIFIRSLNTDRSIFSLRRQTDILLSPVDKLAPDHHLEPSSANTTMATMLDIKAIHLLPIWGADRVARYNATAAAIEAAAATGSQPSTEILGAQPHLPISGIELENEVYQKVADALLLVPSYRCLYPRLPIIELQLMLRHSVGSLWMIEGPLEVPTASAFRGLNQDSQLRSGANTIMKLLNPCFLTATTFENIGTWFPSMANSSPQDTLSPQSIASSASNTSTTAAITVAIPSHGIEENSSAITLTSKSTFLTQTIHLSRFEGTQVALKALLPGQYHNWSLMHASNENTTVSNPDAPTKTEVTTIDQTSSCLNIINLSRSLEAAQLTLKARYTHLLGENAVAPKGAYFITPTAVVGVEYVAVSIIQQEVLFVSSTISGIAKFAATKLGLSSVGELPTTNVNLAQQSDVEPDGDNEEKMAGSLSLMKAVNVVTPAALDKCRLRRVSLTVKLQDSETQVTLQGAWCVFNDYNIDLTIIEGELSSALLFGFEYEQFGLLDYVNRLVIPLCVPPMNSAESYVSSEPVDHDKQHVTYNCVESSRLVGTAYSQIRTPEGLLALLAADFFTPQYSKKYGKSVLSFASRRSSSQFSFREHPTVGLFPRITVSKPSDDGKGDVVLCAHEDASVVIRDHLIVADRAPTKLAELCSVLKFPKELGGILADHNTLRIMCRKLFSDLVAEVHTLVPNSEPEFKSTAQIKQKFDKDFAQGGEMDPEKVQLLGPAFIVSHMCLSVRVRNSTTGKIGIASSSGGISNGNFGYGIHCVASGFHSELTMGQGISMDIAARNLLIQFFPQAFEFTESLVTAEKYVFTQEMKDRMGWDNTVFAFSESEMAVGATNQARCTFTAFKKLSAQSQKNGFQARSQRHTPPVVDSGVAFTLCVTSENFFKAFTLCVDGVISHLSTLNPEVSAIDGQINKSEMSDDEPTSEHALNTLNRDALSLAQELRIESTSPVKDEENDEEDMTPFLIEQQTYDTSVDEHVMEEGNTMSNTSAQFNFMGRKMTIPTRLRPRDSTSRPVSRSIDNSENIIGHTLSIEALQTSKFNGTLLEHIFVILTAKNKRCVSFHTTIGQFEEIKGGLQIKLIGTTVLNTTEEITSVITDADNLLASLFGMYKEAIGEEFWSVIVAKIHRQIRRTLSYNGPFEKLNNFVSRSLKVTEELNVKYFQDSHLWAVSLRVPLSGLGFDSAVGDSTIEIRSDARRTKKEALQAALGTLQESIGIDVLQVGAHHFGDSNTVESIAATAPARTSTHTADSLFKVQRKQASLLDTLVTVATARLIRNHPGSSINFVVSDTGIDFYLTQPQPQNQQQCTALLLWRSNTPSLLNLLRGYATIADSFSGSTDPPLIELLMGSSGRWPPVYRLAQGETSQCPQFIQSILKRYMGWNVIAEGDNSIPTYRAFDKSNSTKYANKLEEYSKLVASSRARESVSLGGAEMSAKLSGFWTSAQFNDSGSQAALSVDSTLGEENAVQPPPGLPTSKLVPLPSLIAWWGVEYDLALWTAKFAFGGHVVGTATSSKKKDAFFTALKKFGEESFPPDKITKMIETDWLLTRDCLIKPSETFQFFAPNLSNPPSNNHNSHNEVREHRNWSVSENTTERKNGESRFRRPKNDIRATLLK